MPDPAGVAPKAAAVDAAPDGSSPTASSERISAVDVLRGVAVLGILLVNIEDFGLPHSEKSAAGTEFVGVYMPALSTRSALVAWLALRVIFEGRMRAIFSMLFGAGIVLLTSRLERRGEGARAADIYFRRTLWLLLFGILHAYLLWEGDILYSYALAGLFLFVFRNLPARRLIVIGTVLLAMTVPRSALVATHRADLRSRASRADADQAAGRPLSQPQEEARHDWQEIRETFEPGPETLRQERDDYLGGYGRLFSRRAELVKSVESSDFYGWGFLITAAMMLIGMGLLKAGVLSAGRSQRFYLATMAIGLAVGVPLGAAANYALYVHPFDPVAVAWITAVYHPARLAVGLAIVSAVMLIVRAGWAGWATRCLSDVGRQALTSYLGATLICTTLFNGYGFGLFGSLSRAQLYAVVLGIWSFQIAFARLWLREFHFGPAEWVWRSLTYWRLQPLRRRGTAPDVARLSV
jgi:uncharacterized protein